MQGVAVPQMSPEIALATVARFAQDRSDPKLTVIAAELAAAYGRGPVALQGPVAALNQYAYDNYHWGDRALSLQLLRPVATLGQASGLDPARQLDDRPPDQRARPSAAPTASAPRPTATVGRDEGADAATRRMLGERAAHQRDMDAFYADPNYKRQLSGDPDEDLDESYLLHRRRLFGKAML